MSRNIPAQDIDRALAKVLRSAYILHGKTQAQLVEATGINETTLGRLFRGDSAWSMSQVYAVVDALGSDKPAEEYMKEAREFIPRLTANV